MNTSEQFVKSFARPPGWVEPEEKPSSNGKAPGQFLKQKADHEHIKDYRFPQEVLSAVLSAAIKNPHASFHAVGGTLMAIFELWYTSGRWGNTPKNPVKLTSAYLRRRFEISKNQKRRALAVLVKAGIVSIEYEGRGQNPWVTLKWKPVSR